MEDHRNTWERTRDACRGTTGGNSLCARWLYAKHSHSIWAKTGYPQFAVNLVANFVTTPHGEIQGLLAVAQRNIPAEAVSRRLRPSPRSYNLVGGLRLLKTLHHRSVRDG